MGEDIASDFTLPALHKLNVRLHASLGEVLGEDVGNIGVRVETSELYNIIRPVFSFFLYRIH
jgi:hypothetical protein